MPLTAPAPAGGKPAAAWLIALRDVIATAAGLPAEVTRKEQDAGPDALVRIGYTEIASGRAGSITCRSSELVTILRGSPARAA